MSSASSGVEEVDGQPLADGSSGEERENGLDLRKKESVFSGGRRGSGGDKVREEEGEGGVGNGGDVEERRGSLEDGREVEQFHILLNCTLTSVEEPSAVDRTLCDSARSEAAMVTPCPPGGSSGQTLRPISRLQRRMSALRRSSSTACPSPPTHTCTHTGQCSLQPVSYNSTVHDIARSI